MAKIADAVVAWTGAAKYTELLVALLLVSLIINIILGYLYGEAGCAVEETMEPKGIQAEAAEKSIPHTHSDVGLIIDASKQGDEYECLSSTWRILEIFVLAALIIVLLNYGCKATNHPACPLGCNKVHKFRSFFFCKKFRALPVARRMRITSSLSLCENCLSGHGKERACPVGLCHACKSPHNTLLCKVKGEATKEAQTSRATLNLPKEVRIIEPALVRKREEVGERTLDDKGMEGAPATGWCSILHATSPKKPTIEGGTPTTLDAKVPTPPTGESVEGHAGAVYEEAPTPGRAGGPLTPLVEVSPQWAQPASNGIPLMKCPLQAKDKEEEGSEVEGRNREKEEAEKRLMLERVKRDLSRYAAGYEAGRIEYVSREQTQRMEDTVRLMKELQGELEERPVQEVEVNADPGTEEEASSGEDTDSEWEAYERIGEKTLLISSAANIRRREIQSRGCPNQVEEHKKGKKRS